MNKKLIALAVAAASISGFASAAEVYSSDSATLSVGGRAEVRTRLNDGDLIDRSRARINVGGTSAITESLTAIGFTEFELNPGKGAIETRLLFAGFQGDFGNVTYGQQNGSLGQITDFSDIFNANGGTNGAKITVADRATQNIAYTNNFGALSLRANYKFEEEGANDAGFSLSGVYTIADFAIGAGYGQQDAAGDDAQQAIAGVSYTGIDNLYLGMTYAHANAAANKVDSGIELAARYTMGKNHVGFGYFTADAVEGDKDFGDVLTLEVGHKFNSNLRGAIGSDINMDHSNKTNINAHLRYDF
uniref:porin n=1 Tax=Thaumasiovibrio occultus TaxID=1891184 RepID=UPI000B35BF68|nr:porin [Thaumasiovibrio occultus]